MPIELVLDNQDVDQFTQTAAAFGTARFGYVVTPNADHLIRYHEDADFRGLYADAAFVLLDSQFLAHLLRVTQGLRVPVCAGSDLTARLFERVIRPEDRIVMIGGSTQQAALLAARFHLKDLRHFNPPMGFIRDQAATEQVLEFVAENGPFRFCLLAVGSPQQEMLAQKMLRRKDIRGLALCIGSSVNFLTGGEQRAPRWMRRVGLEWLFRLLQSPKRLGARYLVRGPRLFSLLTKTHFRLRS